MALKVNRTVAKTGEILELAPRLQRGGGIKTILKELKDAVAWIEQHQRKGWKVLPAVFLSSEDAVLSFQCYQLNSRKRAPKKKTPARRPQPGSKPASRKRK